MSSSLLPTETQWHYRIFFCSNGNTSRWTLTKILLTCCTIVSFKNHDNDDDDDNDNHHWHCHPLKHNHTTEFSFALMEMLPGEHWLKFYLFVAQLFHLLLLACDKIKANLFRIWRGVNKAKQLEQEELLLEQK